MSEEELKRIEAVGGVGRLLVAEVRKLRAALTQISSATGLDAATQLARDALAGRFSTAQPVRVRYAAFNKGFSRRR